MKKIAIFFAIACLYYSCQKTLNNPTPITADCQLTRMVQGLHNDTVYLLSYDASGRLSSVKDSSYSFTATAVYDADGKITSIVTDAIMDTFRIKYKSNGLIASITVVNYFGRDEYFYEFNSNNLPVLRTDIATFHSSNGIVYDSSYRKYQYNAAGDIVRTLDYYDAKDTSYGTVTEYTYLDAPNVFKQLNFFGVADYDIGFYNLLNMDFYFNKKMIRSYTSYAASDPTKQDQTIENYVQDSLNRFVGVISKTDDNTGLGDPSAINTRSFFYNCK
ncbi:MAG: hypothetical protein QM726_26245 [Chitinophagaceae bacterium]